MRKKYKSKILIVAVMAFTALMVTPAFLFGVNAQVETSGLSFGTQVGEYNGVIGYSNYDDDYVSDDYNYVEYVNLYYYVIYGQKIRIQGTNADEYYDAASDRGLIAYPNGGTT
jgi:hypothetical protein